MNDNIEEITKNLPHKNYMALCTATVFKGFGFGPCLKKWLATVPEGTNLFKLECPECGSQNSFVSCSDD